MTNDQVGKWDEEMQLRVHGAAPADDYNFKKDVYPKYSSEPARAQELVSKINASGKYRVNVTRADGAGYSVEVRSADGAERLSLVRNAQEASAICEAIVTADVKL